MPLPSVSRRLTEFTDELDRLQAWDQRLPSAKRWLWQLNELRFVRATLAWEEFLEQSVACYLRGSPTQTGRTYALQVPAARNLQTARVLAIGKNAQFGRWLNENWSMGRANDLFVGTTAYVVLAAPSFKEMRQIRNRIVHRSQSARKDFRGVVLSLYGANRPGITPGRLLTDLHQVGPRRIDTYLQFLRTSATIIAS